MATIEFDIKKQAVADLLKKNPNVTGKDAAEILGISESSFFRCKKSIHKHEQGVLNAIQTNKYKRAYGELLEKNKMLEKVIEQREDELKGYSELSSLPKSAEIVVTDEEIREVVPVIVASDWHIEEKVTAAITNGLNEYDLDIASDSIKQFFDKACHKINQSKEHNTVNTVVLALLGDIINGVLRDEDLESNQATPIEAIAIARSLIYSGIKTIVDTTGCNLRVICCVGNHGRLTERIHFSNQVRNNLEFMLYQTLQRDFRDNPKVTFKVSESYYTIQKIFNVRVRFHHGHSIKFHGGIGGIAVPVLRKTAQMNTIEEADLDVIGHFHSSQMFNNVIVNGSLVGSNGFSMSLGLPHDIPKQTYFEIDSKYGRTTVSPICIDRVVDKQDLEEIK